MPKLQEALVSLLYSVKKQLLARSVSAKHHNSGSGFDYKLETNTPNQKKEGKLLYVRDQTLN